MSSFVIDTSNVSLGQVIRTNITDQGIFRAIYNHICGKMYCALQRESKNKQVISKINLLEQMELLPKLDRTQRSVKALSITNEHT